MPRKEKQLRLNEGHEAGNWKPHKWDAARKQRFCKHVLKKALSAADDGQKTFSENEVMALVRGQMLGIVSRAMIEAAGYQTLGDREL